MPPLLTNERPVTPPWRKPVLELNTPVQTTGFFTELVNRSDSAYQKVWPIPRGTPYANTLDANKEVIDQFSGNPLYFLKQVRPGNTSASDYGSSDLAVIWLWATDQLAQDTFNADVTYDGDATDYPIFTREYDVRRKTWETTPTLAVNTAMTGLLSVNITNAGTGYTYATGTTATGATCVAVVLLGSDGSGGPIIDWVVTNEGTGVTNGAAITITGDGMGATATARIQPAGAVLVSQKKVELPEEHPRSHDYVRIARVYETLPGPWIPFTRYDENYGPIQGRRRAVLNTSQVASQTATLQTTYASRDGSAIVSWQIEEARGSGVPGFVNYPELDGFSLTQEVRGRIVNTVRQIVDLPATPDSGPLVISSVITPRDAFTGEKVTISFDSLPPDEVWAYWDTVSLPLLIFDIVNTVFCNATQFFTLVTNPVTAAGSTVLRKHRKTVSYHATYPNPDLSGSSFETADIRYQGKVIQFSYGNVLNDALSYSGTFSTTSGGGVCTWDEDYSFAATIPDATTFLAGDWYVKDAPVVTFGQGMYIMTKIEYYSAAGNPAI